MQEIADSSIQEDTLQKVPESNIDDNVGQNKIRILTDSDIQLIKEKSKPMTDTLYIPTYDERVALIPDKFLNKYIFGLKDSDTDFILPDDAPIFYAFNEYRELRDYYLFTIIYSDESCCQLNYGITISKKNKEIIDVHLLGLDGGDGGWIENDVGIWENDTSLNLIKASSYDNDIYDSELHQYKREIDTLTVNISLSDIGKFSYNLLDSVRYDTILKYDN